MFCIFNEGFKKLHDRWMCDKKGYYEVEDILEELNNLIQDAQGPMKFEYDSKRKKVIMILILNNIQKGLIEMKEPDDK